MKPDEIDSVCEYLIGTCESVDHALELHEQEATDDNRAAVLERMDDFGFRCESCGWWCETGDYSPVADDVCAECGDEDE